MTRKCNNSQYKQKGRSNSYMTFLYDKKGGWLTLFFKKKMSNDICIYYLMTILFFSMHISMRRKIVKILSQNKIIIQMYILNKYRCVGLQKLIRVMKSLIIAHKDIYLWINESWIHANEFFIPWPIWVTCSRKRIPPSNNKSFLKN